MTLLTNLMKVRVVISDNESENKVVLQISFCNDTIICYTMNLALLSDIKPNILILSTSADKAFKKKNSTKQFVEPEDKKLLNGGVMFYENIYHSK